MTDDTRPRTNTHPVTFLSGKAWQSVKPAVTLSREEQSDFRLQSRSLSRHLHINDDEAYFGSGLSRHASGSVGAVTTLERTGETQKALFQFIMNRVNIFFMIPMKEGLYWQQMRCLTPSHDTRPKH